MFYSCILSAHLLFGVEVATIKSIISIESSFSPTAIGPVGEIGLMQVRPEFSKEKDLYDPCKNIMEGTRILKEAKIRCKHKENKSFVVCYNRGIKGGTRVDDYMSNSYYQKFISKYRYYTVNE